MTAMNEDNEDAETLAIWCARSDLAYNVGAWQAALLLRPQSFREQVAAHLAEMDLAADHPAVTQWNIGLGAEVPC